MTTLRDAVEAVRKNWPDHYDAMEAKAWIAAIDRMEALFDAHEAECGLEAAERDCAGGPRLLGACGCLCHQVATLREPRP
jgi:hypothetical protein